MNKSDIKYGSDHDGRIYRITQRWSRLRIQVLGIDSDRWDTIGDDLDESDIYRIAYEREIDWQDRLPMIQV